MELLHALLDVTLIPFLPEAIHGFTYLTIGTMVKIILILTPLLLTVAYVTYAERKIIGYIQCRIGPNRVGPRGWLQPIADALKLIFKEIVIPTGADRTLFIIAPILSIAPALAAWAVIPFNDYLVLADINAGLISFSSPIARAMIGKNGDWASGGR